MMAGLAILAVMEDVMTFASRRLAILRRNSLWISELVVVG
jgi:hypothetical protein